MKRASDAFLSGLALVALSPLMALIALAEYLLDKKFTFRARPHKRHIADKNIPQLRKLVEAVLAEHTAKARYAGI